MNNNYLILTLSISAFATPLYSMEADTTLLISNYSNDKVEVLYCLKDKIRLARTIEQSQILQLKDPLEEIEEVYVFSYGRLKGKLRASYLSGGLIKEENVVEGEAFRFAQRRKECFQLKVEQGGSTISDYLGYDNCVSRFFKAVLPYSISENPFKLEEDVIPLKGLTIKFFQQVYKATCEDRDILPHYFFELPEDASRESIDKAYQQLVDKWEPQTKSSKERKRELAKHILYIIEQAYKKLIGDETGRYWLMINEEFHHCLPYLSASDTDEPSSEELIDLDQKYFGPQEPCINVFEGPVGTTFDDTSE